METGLKFIRILLLSDGKYQLYDYTDGSRIDYSIDNPDFNFHEFRSNLVAKWEYRLGSFHLSGLVI